MQQAQAVAPRPFGALAPGWVPVKDQASGDTYWWNQQTNETTWERPTAVTPEPSELPSLRRASASRSVYVAPGAAAAAAARTRETMARAGSLANSPNPSAHSPSPGSHCDRVPEQQLRSPPPEGCTGEGGVDALSVQLTASPAVTPSTPAEALREGNTPGGGGFSSVGRRSSGPYGGLTPPPVVLVSPGAAGAIVGVAAACTLADEGEGTRGVLGDSSADEVTKLRPGHSSVEMPLRETLAAESTGNGIDNGGIGGDSRRNSRPGCCRPAPATAKPVATASSVLGAGFIPTSSRAGAKLLSAGATDSAASAPTAAPKQRAVTAVPVSLTDGPANLYGRSKHLPRPVLLTGLAVLGCAALTLVIFLIAIITTSSSSSVRKARAFAPTPPRVLYAGQHNAVLEWSQQAPEDTFSTHYEVQLLRGAKGALPLASYEGLASSRPFSNLPERTSLCARVRLALHLEVTGLSITTHWSECASVRTSGPTAPQPPTLEPLLTATDAITIAWSPPASNGAPLTGYEIQHSKWQFADVDSCAWTGPTCALGCGPGLVGSGGNSSSSGSSGNSSSSSGGSSRGDGGSVGAESNWTQSSARLAPMWERCAGANAVGCCGPFCWCYDRLCCRVSRQFAETPYAVSLSVPLGNGESRSGSSSSGRGSNLNLARGVGDSVSADMKFGGDLKMHAALDVKSSGAAHSFTARARARNAYGWSGWSEALKANTNAVGARAPSQMAKPQFETSKGSVRLKWELPVTNGAQVLGFDIQLALADAPAGAMAAAEASAAYNATEVVVEGLAEGTHYLTIVRARSSAGNSAWTEAVKFRADAMRPPGPPTQLTVQTRFADALRVRWPAVTDETASVTAYELQWRRAGHSNSEQGWKHGCSLPSADGADSAGSSSRLFLGESSGSSSSSSPEELREHLQAPDCTLGQLTTHTAIQLRARSHSLAGWGPWGPPTDSTTLAMASCGSLTDQQRVWAQNFNNELQTCSADCWGQPQCTVHCLQGVELSGQCARCFGAAVACSKSDCHSACAWSPAAAGCKECTARSCWPELSNCAGAELPRDVL
mmetsp:Transcript_24168/g.55865  ORF Transcript_24168/g.55865 Transcript_24168/m.55865 type:complete len:1058 (+) Transcript_24168:34-3207(+)